jgi:hypothetical protein
MRTAVGAFVGKEDAKRAIERLSAIIPRDKISVLAPERGKADLASVPVTEDMPPAGAGMAAALGGALGLGLGVLIFLPAVGAITALGALASTLFGIGGAVAGGLAGKAADEALSSGVPADELYIYEDALRRGRIVVIAHVEDDAQKAKALKVLNESGAESLDAARENWWVGLRSAEELEYDIPGRTFAADEAIFRQGFEAALDAKVRGKSYDEAKPRLKERNPTSHTDPAYRRGYERGRAHWRRLSDTMSAPPKKL